MSKQLLGKISDLATHKNAKITQTPVCYTRNDDWQILDYLQNLKYFSPLQISLASQNKPRVIHKKGANVKQAYIYMLFSKPNGTLYVGVTSDLAKRIYEHKNKAADGFTKKYGVDKLGYYEAFDDMASAILREKQLKGGNRAKKIELITKSNPQWKDLYEDLICGGF
ncbi:MULTISPECIES: GIY-YIG nuclease family protein [unclassified Helicobacter]|uniref:GIY-YIG nuclease family protein n=1 Tax=unclassified Helicobacter TaxID=2593540 RepID=UPI0018F82B4D|nr:MULTISPECIES: GIY-YIG nuclease family protein [unclassified Helicobacter]